MSPRVRPDFASIARAGGEDRTIAQIIEHYCLETELARRLKMSDRPARRKLYREVYEELFAKISHHPQHTRPHTGSEHVEAQAGLLRTLVPQGGVFVEIGAGDGRLSIAMAGHCAQVVAVDVTATIADTTAPPANFRFLLTDGTAFDLEDDSVDFAYSNQLMEHLHPDDAREQLREIYRILRHGGRYFCITPNANSGPHDISMFFDRRASGLHLKEYSYGSLAQEMRIAGFASARPMLVRKRKSYRMPLGAARAIEIVTRMAERLPGPSLRLNPKVRALLGVNMLAVK